MKFINFLLGLAFLLIIHPAQTQVLTYQINYTFTSNTEIFPFSQNDFSYGLSINGNIHLNTDSSMVRVMGTSKI